MVETSTKQAAVSQHSQLGKVIENNKYTVISMNIKNVLSGNCRSLSNCEINKTGVGNFSLLLFLLEG